MCNPYVVESSPKSTISTLRSPLESPKYRNSPCVSPYVKLSPPVPSPLPSSGAPFAVIRLCNAVSVYRPSASEPLCVSAPEKLVSVTTVTPLTYATVAWKVTEPPPLRVSVNALTALAGKVTTWSKVNVRLVTRERWAEPSLTITLVIFGGTTALTVYSPLVPPEASTWIR